MPRTSSIFSSSLALLLCLSATVSTASTPTLRITSVAPGPGHSLTGNAIDLFGGDGNDDSRSVSCDAQGACTLFGYTNKSFGDSTDFLAVHLTSTGSVEWVRTYGGTNRDELRYAAPVADGGALMIGMTNSLFYTSLKVFSPSRPARPLLVRIGKDGDVQWSMSMDTYSTDFSALQFEHGTATPDGGFILTGIYMVGEGQKAQRDAEHDWTWKGPAPASSDKGYSTMAVMKLAGDGQVVWLRRYAVTAGNTAAWGADVGADGHILLLGHITQTNNLIWLHLDMDGHVTGAETMTDPVVALPMLLRSSDGGRVVIGWSSSGAGKPGGLFAEKYSANGDIQWAHSYTYTLPVASMDAALNSADELCVVGRLNGGNESRAIALAIDGKGDLISVATLGESKPTEFTGVSALPNARCRLLGDTYDYGAVNADVVSLVWDASKDPDGLSGKFVRADFTPKFDSTSVSEAIVDTKGIHLLPASAVTVQTVPVPAASTAAASTKRD